METFTFGCASSKVDKSNGCKSHQNKSLKFCSYVACLEEMKGMKPTEKNLFSRLQVIRPQCE
jgi:hypothetical protein